MSQKRKISIRKVLQTVFTILLTGGCVAAILSASKIQQNEKLRDIYLHVRNEHKYQFLDKQQLLQSVKTKNHLVAGITKLNSINLKSIEQQIYQDPWVAEAQVYVDNQKNMHIYATQNVPTARVFFENGQSFYLNDSLKLLPTSDKFTYYTTVVTNVPWVNNDSINKVARAQVLAIVKAIEKDSFWNAQVEQISMTPDMEFELYPVLGHQKILFGDTSMAKRKLENLLGFYKTVLNKIGWDKYEILDARYKDQVIASPALAWKMPAKGFISNMDWVKTIMGDEPKTENKNQPKLTTAPIATTKAKIEPVQKPASVKTTTPSTEKKLQTPIAASKTASQKTATTSKPAPTSIEKNKTNTTPKPTIEKKNNTTNIKNETKEKKSDNSQKPKYILN